MHWERHWRKPEYRGRPQPEAACPKTEQELLQHCFVKEQHKRMWQTRDQHHVAAALRRPSRRTATAGCRVFSCLMLHEPQGPFSQRLLMQLRLHQEGMPVQRTWVVSLRRWRLVEWRRGESTCAEWRRQPRRTRTAGDGIFSFQTMHKFRAASSLRPLRQRRAHQEGVMVQRRRDRACAVWMRLPRRTRTAGGAVFSFQTTRPLRVASSLRPLRQQRAHQEGEMVLRRT
mmetsp:Transcript_20492/g.57649  ORF Transcript_20492/g.57649 Transcript_20492/m.57649 type:complete len:229 (+) Transcript_20492:253-939(+)